jgi:signal transduction histidine kinase
MEHVLSCQWDQAFLLIFSKNIFDPVIFYSHFVPILTSLSLVGILMWNRKFHVEAVLLIVLNVLFVIWTIIDLVLWGNERLHVIMFFWSILAIFDLSVHLIAFVFYYHFCLKKPLSLFLKILLFLFLLPPLVYSSTWFTAEYFDYTNCEREVFEGWVWSYVYIVAALLNAFILGLLFVAKKSNNKEAVHMGAALLIFTGAFLGGNLLGSWTRVWELAQYGLFGMSVFSMYVMYLMMRFKTFNVKIHALQFFFIALFIFVISQVFFATSHLQVLSIFFTIIILAILSYFALQYFKSEHEQRELSIKNKYLQELNDSKDEFISLAAHQLKTPLQNIISSVEKIKDIEEEKHKIITGTDQISGIVNDLASLVRLKEGSIELYKETFDLHSNLDKLIAIFDLDAERKDILLQWDYPDEKIPPITADRTKLLEALSNLIENALKYTPEGGTVRVTLREEVTRQDQRTILILIQDSGAGIPEDEYDSIFEKFSRGKDQKTSGIKGTGIGLYIVKRYIDAHGGTITVGKSEMGGARFEVKINI